MGLDGRKAVQLLSAAQKLGVATLGTLAKAAVGRLLQSYDSHTGSARVLQSDTAQGTFARRKPLLRDNYGPTRGLLGSISGPDGHLFTDKEREQLAKALAAVTATAELLGRARIRRLQEQAQKQYANGGNGEQTVVGAAQGFAESRGKGVKKAWKHSSAPDSQSDSFQRVSAHERSHALMSAHIESFAESALHVRLVDSTALRSRSLDWQEFGLWATHADYPEIPLGEIWISDATDPIDRRYFLVNARHVHEGLARGMSADDANDYGLAAERAERERNTLGGHGKDHPTHEEIPAGVYVQLWKVLERDGERVQVWLVKGRAVREAFKTDFFSGGHAFVYPWVPENEIWIEVDKRPIERLADLEHEVTERADMKHEQLGYDQAHDHAAKREFVLRRRLLRAQKHSETFECFKEVPLKPLAPDAAIEYFRKLVPQLNVDPATWIDAQGRRAFTMAEATEQELLEKVHELILGRIETGQGISSAPREIDALLHDAGVSPKNPQYSEMVFRTNAMESYRNGATEELQHPDVIGDFPVYRYIGIDDGREGEDHKPHFNKYYPSNVPFAEVRDSLVVRKGEVVPSGGKGRPFN